MTRIPTLFLLTVIIAVVVLFLLANTSNFVDDRNGQVTVEVTRPVPVYITAVPEPDIPRDLWRCLQNPTLAQNAPDVTLDHNNFDVIDLRITEVAGGQGQINVYQVYNHARNEAKPVSTEWGIGGTGNQELIRCDVPEEWGNFPPPSTPFPLNTPINQPGEGVGQPES